MLASFEVGRKRVLHVEDWAEIRGLHPAERLPIKVIARLMGISRDLEEHGEGGVGRGRSTGVPAYRRTGMGLIVDGVEPRIRELLAAYPSMPATVIAERVGWDRSIRVLSSRQRGDLPRHCSPSPPA